MHPLLIPGAHVLRRDAGQVQVGLDPGLVLPAPGVSSTTLGDDPPVTRTLVRAGLATTDDRPLRGALPGHAEGQVWARHTFAALARRTGSDLAPALDRRRSTAVRIGSFGHPLGEDLAEDLTRLLDRSGLSVVPVKRRRAAPDRRPVSVEVLVGVGEPARELVDGFAREGLPYLVVRLVEGRAVIGPFVLPGATACLRCTDAYRTELDPSWPLLVEQYSRATRTDRADGIPEPVDAALAAVAVGWAARDLATYAEGGEPTSWSASVTLSPVLASVERQPWPLHPNCGCAWS